MATVRLIQGFCGSGSRDAILYNVTTHLQIMKLSKNEQKL